MTRPGLRTRELDEPGCRALLARRSLGRLAFSFRDRVDIQPLNFVLDGEWIFGRTSEGEKLNTLRHHRWVAFQVDEVASPVEWTSVVVRGPFHLLHEDRSAEGEKVLRRARAAVSRRFPGAFDEGDPAPHRNLLFGIAIQELSGRTATPAE